MFDLQPPRHTSTLPIPAVSVRAARLPPWLGLRGVFCATTMLNDHRIARSGLLGRKAGAVALSACAHWSPSKYIDASLKPPFDASQATSHCGYDI